MMMRLNRTAPRCRDVNNKRTRMDKNTNNNDNNDNNKNNNRSAPKRKLEDVKGM